MRIVRTCLSLFFALLLSMGVSQQCFAETPPFTTPEELVAKFQITRVYVSNYGGQSRLWLEGTESGKKVTIHVSPEGTVHLWDGDNTLANDPWIYTIKDFQPSEIQRLKLLLEKLRIFRTDGERLRQTLVAEKAIGVNDNRWTVSADGIRRYWIQLANFKWAYLRQVASTQDPKKEILQLYRWMGDSKNIGDIATATFPLELLEYLEYFVGVAAAEGVSRELKLVKYFPELTYGGKKLVWAQTTDASWYFLWTRDGGASFDIRKWNEARSPKDLDSPEHRRFSTLPKESLSVLEAAIQANKQRLNGAEPKKPELGYKPIPYLHLPPPASALKEFTIRPGDEKNAAYYVAYRPFRDYFPIAGITKANCVDFARSWAADIELDTSTLTIPVNNQGPVGFYSRPVYATGYKSKEDAFKGASAYLDYFLSFALKSCEDHFRQKPSSNNNSTPPADNYCRTVTDQVYDNMSRQVRSQQESLTRVLQTKQRYCFGGSQSKSTTCRRIQETEKFVRTELNRLNGLLYQMKRCRA